ncbi:hypothetical protein [Lutibaculum baratangense]|uniref:Uncharacterized protein n=1 Tax=Lutibaculum baratangense AMV1 TaxID=631454 RepID=V4RFR8_9HYPH|nr:hypothetical protein [Lutibaculum baratangense]ESR24224.1 hypothetical protein N177_2673 [Lutibaculum baratangense AMV1]
MAHTATKTTPRNETLPMCGSADMPMTEILGALRVELGELAASARQVEGLLADLVARVDPSVVDSVVTDAQLVDAMSQRLEALEIYVRALRGLTPGEWEMDPRPASALLTVSQLARRLTGEQEEEEASGEFELF